MIGQQLDDLGMTLTCCYVSTREAIIILQICGCSDVNEKSYDVTCVICARSEQWRSSGQCARINWATSRDQVRNCFLSVHQNLIHIRPKVSTVLIGADWCGGRESL